LLIHSTIRSCSQPVFKLWIKRQKKLLPSTCSHVFWVNSTAIKQRLNLKKVLLLITILYVLFNRVKDDFDPSICFKPLAQNSKLTNKQDQLNYYFFEYFKRSLPRNIFFFDNLPCLSCFCYAGCQAQNHIKSFSSNFNLSR
jgi:hypothetical protein